MKRVISFLLSVVMIFSIFGAVDLSAYANQQEKTNVETVLSSTSEDDVTDLFADAINEEQQLMKQEVNSVSRIIFSGETATVTLKTTIDSTLIIAVYTEDGTQLLGTGTEYITEESTEVDVVIDIDEMPQYFTAKGYIVDTLSMKPISEVYNCEYYTHDMQTLFESTVDSYDINRVINFDDSDNNNFAVYKDTVILETQSENTNVLESKSNGTYIISNPSETIRNLKQGDIFSLNYNDENLIVIKVANITVSSNTVVITEDDNIDLDEVFDYVKISNSNDLYDIEEQNTPKKAASRSSSEDELIGKNSNQQSISVSKYSGSAKVTGSLELSLTVGVDIFITLKNQSIDVYVDYGLFLNFNITAKGNATYNFNVFNFTIIPGLSINAEPKVTINFEVVMNLDVSYTGRIGFKLDTKGGFTNLSSAPTLNGSLNLTGKISLSFGMKISLSALYGVISGYINPSITLTLTAKLDNASNHLCAVCYAGNLKYSADLGYGIEFLKGKKSLSNTVNIGNGNICDFYYSVSNNKFDKGICPNKNNNKTRELHCVTPSGTPARFATVDLYIKSCSCDTSNFMQKWKHRFSGLSHYTLCKRYVADSKGVIKFTLDATEEGYDYMVKASYNGNSTSYFFPWGGGPIYPIEIKENDSTMNYNLNSYSLIEDENTTEFQKYTIEKTESNDGTRYIKYGNLIPNETYNFYSLKYIDYLCSLVSDNILYINQYTADENGNLSISFKPSELTDSFEDCLLAMNKDNINISNVKQPDINCRESENGIHPLVTIYGQILQEGIDYILEGEIKTVETGLHTFNVVGIGNYYGKIKGTYNVTLYMDDYNAICEKVTDIMKKEYYSEDTMYALKKAYDTCNVIVTSTDKQVDIDAATVKLTEKINQLEYIDNIKETTGSLTWEWDKETQSIIISGEGKIEDAPWEKLKEIIKKIEIKDGITEIKDSIFGNYSEMNELIIADSVIKIGNKAFENCWSIEKVTVPASVSYGTLAFDNDTAINEINITYGTDGIVKGFNNLAVIDGSIVDSDKYGPWRYSKNAIVKMENGITAIGNNAFNKCSGIKSIEIPITVEEIAKGNFKTADAATEITILNPNCTIQEGSFTGSNTIIGYSNSTAEVFADDNSIPFKAIDEHIHTYGEWTYNGDAEYVSSTNYKNGTQTRVCSVCGKEETVEAPNTALLRRRGNASLLKAV